MQKHNELITKIRKTAITINNNLVNKILQKKHILKYLHVTERFVFNSKRYKIVI